MQGFIAGVAISFIILLAYFKACVTPKLNKQIKVAYRKGWDACRNDCVKMITESTCKRSDE